MDTMRIFITGGHGFIGSHVVDGLRNFHQVTIYDNMTSAVRTQVPGVTSITGDICDQELLTHSMKQHDVVIAMAAAHLRVSLHNPLSVHEVNGTGNLTTLIAAKENRIKRFIYISSSEVYGTATDTLMNEEHEINPTTVYGVSKYIGELYTQQFKAHESMHTTIIRPFNTYGPRSHFDGYYGEVIPRMAIRLLNNEPPIIFGDGSQTRDFTYATDTAAGIISCINSKKTVGQTINIAYGKEVSIQTIAEVLCQTINPKIKPVYKNARPQDVARHAADTKRAKQLLKWNPHVSIQQGLAMYINWLKQEYPTIQTIRSLIPDINW